MFTRLLILAAIAAAAVASYAGASTGRTHSTAAFHPVIVAKLSAKTEVPKKGPTAGTGSARITLNLKTNRACWTFSVKGLDKTLSAHIHKGVPGKAGPVIIPLGAKFMTKGCVTVPQKSMMAVGKNPRAYYVNVHTRKYLNGAIRGQLRAG